VNRLIASLDAALAGPHAKVYAELGSTWFRAMRNPDEAAHVLGKLLQRLGSDRVLWGTDSIWYGSPQNQIEAFRNFEISNQFQDRYGYPELTADVKKQVFGQNAARLYGVDPRQIYAITFGISADDLESARQETALSNRTYGPLTPAAIAASFAADHPWAV